MKHDAHGLVDRWNHEIPGSPGLLTGGILEPGNIIFPARFIGLQRNWNREAPERFLRVLIELESIYGNRLAIRQTTVGLGIFGNKTNLAHNHLWLPLTRIGDNQHTSIPYGGGFEMHALVIEQWPTNHFNGCVGILNGRTGLADNIFIHL